MFEIPPESVLTAKKVMAYESGGKKDMNSYAQCCKEHLGNKAILKHY